MHAVVYGQLGGKFDPSRKPGCSQLQQSAARTTSAMSWTTATAFISWILNKVASYWPFPIPEETSREFALRQSHEALERSLKPTTYAEQVQGLFDHADHTEFLPITQNIQKFLESYDIKQAQSHSTHPLRDTTLARYIGETWLCELGPMCTISEASELVCNIVIGKRDLFQQFGRDEQRTWDAVSNLTVVTYAIFAKKRVPEGCSGEVTERVKAARKDIMNELERGFSVELAKVLHLHLAHNLVGAETHCSKPGSFATVPRSAGSTVFIPHDMIAERMAVLFAVTRKEMDTARTIVDPAARILRIMTIAAIFFRLFLLIHPFPDVNGRTARVLLSILLVDVTPVPLSLYCDTIDGRTPREYYYQVLLQYNEASFPVSLLQYVLMCAITQLSSIVVTHTRVTIEPWLYTTCNLYM